MVLDREGRIVQFNRVCQQLTGYSVEEVRGRLPWDSCCRRRRCRRSRKSSKKVLGGTPNQTENHWVTKDGRRLLIGWSNSGVTAEGSVESVIATGIDQTERGRARQKGSGERGYRRALLETAAQAILAMNRQGQIVLANAATEKMFGYSRR